MLIEKRIFYFHGFHLVEDRVLTNVLMILWYSMVSVGMSHCSFQLFSIVYSLGVIDFFSVTFMLSVRVLEWGVSIFFM